LRSTSPIPANNSFSEAFDAPEPLGLTLDDVDLFLDLPEAAPGLDDSDIIMSDLEFPNHIPLPSAPAAPPTLTTDTSYYYNESDGEDSDSNESRLTRRRLRPNTEPKAGTSWARQKQLITESKDKDFSPKSSRLGSFRAKVLKDDSKAEFDDNNVRRVRCSHCATWVVMRALYDVRRWTEHRATGKCIKSRETGLVTKSLGSLGFVKVSAQPAPPAPKSRLLPCPGLTRESNEDIATYMARTEASGGGAPSRARIARELFASEEIEWRDLSASDQRMVIRRQISLQRWKVGRSVGAIFASDCDRDVLTPDGRDPEPCSACRTLLSFHPFQVAIHRPIPDESNMKFVPVAHRDPELGNIYLKYHGVRELVEQVSQYFSTFVLF
jgi:hypothetical protein